MSLPAANGLKTVRVLLPVPLRDGFDYKTALPLAVGQMVTVPFGKRVLQGVVEGAGSDHLPYHKLKEVLSVIPDAQIPAALIKLVRWVANYTLSPAGAVLKMVYGGSEIPKQPKASFGYRIGKKTDISLSNKAKSALEIMSDGSTQDIKSICTAAQCTSAVVKNLEKLGLLVKTELPRTVSKQPEPDFSVPLLTEPQATAVQSIVKAVQSHHHQTMLLDGVTGSGKTEVYCEAIASCLRQDQQAVVLMPEITLTTGMTDRFTKRFGVEPTVWHSAVSAGKRAAQWWEIMRGEAKLVIGARSALFLPYKNLGLIVVDEEHDASYKQEDGVVYNARDMAVLRGKLENCPVVLSSATPSLETYQNSLQGKYQRLSLPLRYGGAELPAVDLIDLRKEKLPRQRWLCERLVNDVKNTLQQGQQAMLFLNRRGYAPLTLCRACGHRLQCPHCSAWLVMHDRYVSPQASAGTYLACHHCARKMPLPKACPQCKAEDKLAACGPGVERIAEEVSQLLPEARVAILASDTTGNPKEILTVLNKIKNKDINLLIGTQLVAKGHHFPDLSLVGVVDADIGLGGGDPRAAERSFQLLHQVSGRSGRGDIKGRVVIQTTQPDHPVMKALAANDRDGFLQAEAAEREKYKLPPYVRLAGVVIAGPQAEQVDHLAEELANSAPASPDIQVLGPAPAPMSKLRGKHRRRLLLRTTKDTNIQALLRDWLLHRKLPSQIKLSIDVDPYSFM